MLWTALKPPLSWIHILPEPGYNKALAMQCLGRDREAMAAIKTADVLEGNAVGCSEGAKPGNTPLNYTFLFIIFDPEASLIPFI